MLAPATRHATDAPRPTSYTLVLCGSTLIVEREDPTRLRPMPLRRFYFFARVVASQLLFSLVLGPGFTFIGHLLNR